jgi:hypothetical protein
MAEITVHFIEQFKDNLQLALQNPGGIYQGMVDVAYDYEGKGAQPLKTVGEVELEQITTRFASTPMGQPEHYARWIVPQEFARGTLVDPFDLLKVGTNPTSTYQMAQRKAAMRKFDALIRSAFFGTALTGDQGGTSTVFDTTNQVVASSVGGSNTGLNVAKLAAAREILATNYALADDEKPMIAISPKQMTNLINSAQITSVEFSKLGVVMSGGKVTEILGFAVIEDPALPAKTGNDRYCPVWVKSGMHLGVWKDIEVKVSELPEKNYATQLYIRISANAIRTDEKKVVRVACYEA